MRGEEGGGLVGADRAGDAAAGDADAVADEQHAVATGDVGEVGRQVDGSGDGARRSSGAARAGEQLGDAAAQQVVAGVGEPGPAERRHHRLARRAGRPRCGAGSGRRRRRTAARRCGARPCRSRSSGPSAQTGLRGMPTSSRAMRPPGRTTRASSAKKASRSTRLRSANPHVDPVDGGVARTGRRRMSACTRGAPLRSARSIPKLGRPRSAAGRSSRRSMHRSPVPLARSSDGGSRTAGRNARTARRAPAHVEAERHDPVDEVVARRDGVEHVAHRLPLLVALGQRVAVPAAPGPLIGDRLRGRPRAAGGGATSRAQR